MVASSVGMNALAIAGASDSGGTDGRVCPSPKHPCFTSDVLASWLQTSLADAEAGASWRARADLGRSIHPTLT